MSKIISGVTVISNSGEGVELFCSDEVGLEIFDASPESAEVAFNCLGKRTYVKFNVADLIAAIHAHGRGA